MTIEVYPQNRKKRHVRSAQIPRMEGVWLRRFRVVVCLASLSVALLSANCALELAKPGIFPSMLPISEVFYQKARSAKTVNEAIAYARQAIGVAPRRPENQMLAAYLYFEKSGSIDPMVIDAIRKSYMYSPAGTNVSDYRLDFIFRYWGRFPKDVRDSAKREVSMYASTWRGQKFLGDHIVEISNPEDRLYIAIITIIAKQKIEAGSYHPEISY